MNDSDIYNINNSEERYNKIFKLVFGNIVLLRIIYQHARFYKKYQKVKFLKSKSLQEHKYKEYISKIDYRGTYMLELGDLPIGGVLKEFKLHQFQLSKIKGDLIPYGVEILEYCSWSFLDPEFTTPFSTLPKTIHTLKNVVIPRINHENNFKSIYGKNFKNDKLNYKIPDNITSISFRECYHNISGKNEFIVIPNSVKELTFNRNWDNTGIILRKGDIPDSVTKLEMLGYSKYTNNLTVGILPNSIKELSISSCNCSIFNYLPLNLVKLDIFCNGNDHKITQNSNLVKLTSLKYLSIQCSDLILPNSLPSSLTKLKLYHFQGLPDYNTIPSNVKSLTLHLSNLISVKYYNFTRIPSTQLPKLNEVLPLTLTHLRLGCASFDNYSNDYIKKSIITLLPTSITSLILPFHLHYIDVKSLIPKIKVQFKL